jgi:hypothetical protein
LKDSCLYRWPKCVKVRRATVQRKRDQSRPTVQRAFERLPGIFARPPHGRVFFLWLYFRSLLSDVNRAHFTGCGGAADGTGGWRT